MNNQLQGSFITCIRTYGIYTDGSLLKCRMWFRYTTVAVRVWMGNYTTSESDGCNYFSTHNKELCSEIDSWYIKRYTCTILIWPHDYNYYLYILVFSRYQNYYPFHPCHIISISAEMFHCFETIQVHVTGCVYTSLYQWPTLRIVKFLCLIIVLRLMVR